MRARLRYSLAFFVLFGALSSGQSSLDPAAVKINEALRESERSRALDPQKSLYARQFARALLAAGAGESARAEARRAIELEPDSAAAYIDLAEVLKNDLIGRPLARGFDRDGSVEAYRKALELNPIDAGTRANLAILLEHDRSGVRYAAGAKLEEAIAEYAKVVDILSELGVSKNYGVVLMRTGRMAELRDYVRKQPASEANQALLVCAEAALSGTKVALERAGEISITGAKQRILTLAFQTLIAVRRYALAAGVMELAGIGSPRSATDSKLLQVFKKAQAIDSMPSSAAVPEDAVRTLIYRIARLEQHETDWFESLSALTRDEPSMSIQSVQRALASSGGQTRPPALAPEIYADLLNASMQFWRQGDDEKGYTVRLTLPNPFNTGIQTLDCHVIKENGSYKILTLNNLNVAVGTLALRLVEGGNAEKARSWLDQIRTRAPGSASADPFSGPLFARLWQSEKDATHVRQAAVALLFDYNSPKLAGYPSVLEGADTSAAVTAALVESYLLSGQSKEAFSLAETLLKSYPASPTAFALALRSAYAAGGLHEGRRIADANLARFNSDTRVLRRAANLAVQSGDSDRSIDITRQLVDSGRGEGADFNRLAWAEVVAGKVTAATLEMANRGIPSGGKASLPSQHTIAAIYAELGRVTEARAAILKRIEEKGKLEPDGDDWYVFGRIAEQYGLTQDAASMYERIPKPLNEWAIPSSSYSLAQRRLKAR